MSGQSLVLVIAIMTFLSCLTLGAVTMIRDTAAVWQTQIAREATIQIKPAEGLDMGVALVKAADIAAGFAGVTAANAGAHNPRRMCSSELLPQHIST